MADLEYLASDHLEGRKPLSNGSLLARQFIKHRFQELGLTSQYPDFTQYFSFVNRRDGRVMENAANIVGFIPGEQTDQLIVIMAHYDHLGKIGESIFNGADDNASGTAAVMAIAAYFSRNRPKHSMMFVALDAEEMGHQGAKALVADFPFDLKNVVLNINLDMVSRNDDNEIYAVGTYHFPFLKPMIHKVSEGRQPKLLFGHDEPGSSLKDWTMSSDHSQFFINDIPFIYFGVEDHKDYHKETDIFENIHPEFYVSTVELILEIIISLDNGMIEKK
ncbi:M28 family peptidase [Shivajiella indica]|uniref:M28 family peptidase n=1 Tax=Shivajiella indica TaxID=872115 RepID=A0ABW5B6Y3_9BACT